MALIRAIASKEKLQSKFVGVARAKDNKTRAGDEGEVNGSLTLAKTISITRCIH